MSAVAAAIGVGVAGAAMAGSSYLQGQEAKSAAGKARDQANAQMLFNTMRRDENVRLLDPYIQAGAQGLGKYMNFDLQEGVGPQVSYDTEYTNKLKDYSQSPAFTAQNEIAQQALGRASHARGLDTGRSAANAQGELTRNLVASDYDKYKGDLFQRYKALQGEYGQRQQNNLLRYQQLMDQTGLGKWGLGQKFGLDQALSGQNAQQSANVTSANNAEAQGMSNMWKGMGQAVSQTAGGLSSAYGMGAGGAGGGGSMFSSDMGLNGQGQPIQNLVSQNSAGYTWPGATF